ncbi:CSC1-like protein 2 [Galdieria sulphuraria]|nr:CSC1-like protein 2 [Galdieria sulphuraria]
MVNIEGSSVQGHTTFVLYVNIVTCAFLGSIFYFIRQRKKPLTASEQSLLREFPSVRSLSDFTPLDSYVPSPPPASWNGLWNFLTSDFSLLSKDARVYLLFQRLCIILILFHGSLCYLLLLPCYFWISRTSSVTAVLSEIAFLDNSMLNLLLILIVLAFSVYVMYIFICISVAGRVIDYESQTFTWTEAPHRQQLVCSYLSEQMFGFSPSKRSEQQCPRMLLLSNVSRNITDRSEIFELLDTLYPSEIAHVEILYRRRACRSKLIRMLHRAQRREYFYIQLFNCCSDDSLLNGTREILDSLGWKKNLLNYSFGKLLLRWSLISCQREVRKIEQQLEVPHSHFASDSSGCAFVLFHSQRTAFLCLQDFPIRKLKVSRSSMQSFVRRPQSDKEALLVSLALSRLGENVQADIAPNPRDIIWNNVGIPASERFWREVILNSVTGFFLLLFTSPFTILSTLRIIVFYAAERTPFLGIEGLDVFTSNTVSELAEKISRSSIIGPFVIDYAPVFLLSCINALMPTFFRRESALEGYLSRSEEEQSIFRKLFLYYLFNTVLLPLLALNTAAEILEQLLSRSESSWNPKDFIASISERVFTGSNSYFYLNFIIQLTFTSNSLSLSRLFPTLFSFFRNVFSFNPLELTECKCNELFDFPLHYATTLKILAIYLCLGLVVPILWPVTLLFFIAKHLTDAYNLNFVHPRSAIDGRLPRSVVRRLLFCTILSHLLLCGRFLLTGSITAATVLIVISFTCILVCTKFATKLGPPLLKRILYSYSGEVNTQSSTITRFFGGFDAFA